MGPPAHPLPAPLNPDPDTHTHPPPKKNPPRGAGVFAAYAKYKHDRADLFVPLSRALNEDRLLALPDAELGPAVTSLVRAFETFGFWPEATEALFVIASVKRPAAFGPAEKADIDAAIAKVEAAAGGNLGWLRGGYADPEHFHGAHFSNYNLWALRDELTAESYKPADFKVWKKQ